MKKKIGGIYHKYVDILNHITSFGGYLGAGSTRFLRFATSSSFTLVIDMILLFFFVETLNIFYLIAAGLSFTISTSINYAINRNWGFQGTVTGFFKGFMLFSPRYLSLFSVLTFH